MNERIQKLVGMALDKAVPYTWHNLDHNEVEKVMEKFAVLIVRECAEVARLNTRVDSKVYLMIQEHFGVEE